MKAKFYVATLAAAIERAARVAPNKGVAFDKAAGIIMEIDPATGACLRATDLEVYYREEIRDVVDLGDEAGVWRLPAHLLHGIVAGLPLDKEVTFKEEENQSVRIFCGRKQAKLKMLPADLFPRWDRVPRDELKPVPGFATRVSQVSWACDTQNVPFTGVHVDGTHLNATNRVTLARVPCDVPVEERITVAMTTLAPIMKNFPGEVSLAATSDELLLAVGDEIEARCVLFAQKYPDLAKALRDDFEFEVKVPREELIEAINSMLVLVKNERYPVMSFDFEEGGIALFMSVPETGDMSDVIEAEFDGQFSIKFTPDYVMRALEGATSKFVTWSLGPSPKAMTRIEDTDYVAYVMPRDV
jgi:DNA polymerase III sliding clamp (beta) subunit (PCNA family)